MAKSGIKFTYLNGGPGSITSITCLSSSPRLGGSIVLTPFNNLTAFNGGDNSLEAVLGFESLTALSSFRVPGANTINFNISSLPTQLKIFELQGENTAGGNLINLPRGLIEFTNTGFNQTSGVMGSLPRSLKYYYNAGALSGFVIRGPLSDLPRDLTFFRSEGRNTISGDLSGLPRDLTYYRNEGVNTTSGVLSGLPRGLTYYYNEGNNITSGNLSGLPTNLTYYNNAGNNTTTGLLTGLPPNLETYINTGFNTVSGDLSHLPTSLVYFWHGGDNEGLLTGNLSALSALSSLETIVIQRNTITGSLSSLPRSLEQYNIRGSNTISGTLNSLPSSLTFFDSRGSNTISGNLSGLPRKLTYYNNGGRNTVIGNLSSLPPCLTTLGCGGSSTTTGDLANLPIGLTSYSTIASSVVFGDIASLPSGLIEYQNLGNNTTRGDIANLPRGLVQYINSGQNTTTGNLNFLPDGLKEFTCRGLNEIAGDIKDLPNSLEDFRCTGSNTTTGNLSTLPPNLKFYENSPINTVYSYYDGENLGYKQRVWANNQRYWELQPALSSFVPGVTDYTPGQPLDADTVAFANNIPSMSNEEKMYIDMFVLGSKALGLWNDMVCWPLLSSQNSGTNTVYSLGGSGTFNGTLSSGNNPLVSHTIQWTGQGLFSNTNTNRVVTQKLRSNYNQRTFYAVGRASQAYYNSRARYIFSSASETGFIDQSTNAIGMFLNDTISGHDQSGAGVGYDSVTPYTSRSLPEQQVGVAASPPNTLNTWATHTATFSNRIVRNYRDAVLRGTSVTGGSWADSITDGDTLTLMNSRLNDNEVVAGLIGYMAFGADFEIGLTQSQIVAFDYLYKLTLGRSLPLVKLATTEASGMPHTHLATLLVDLSGATWDMSRQDTLITQFKANVNNPTLSSSQPYWGKVQAAIQAIRSQGVTVTVLTAA